MLESAAQRSLVIFPGALGDFLCFLPTLRFLGEGKQVDLLAHSEFADLVPPAVKVRSLERYEIRRLFVSGSSRENECVTFLVLTRLSFRGWEAGRARLSKNFIRRLKAEHVFFRFDRERTCGCIRLNIILGVLEAIVRSWRVWKSP